MDELRRTLLPLPEAPIAVGFSGGLDSTVLLHALVASASARAHGLRAIHVHHGMHPDADAWAAHCTRVCVDLGVPLSVSRVQVDHAAGRGPEGAARAARLGAFQSLLRDGELVALAHHRDDQAETILLRLMRGAGGDGLAAMRRRSRIGELHLWRPLLELPRSALHDYATSNALRWIEDPSNADVAYDRNFLRHRVLPSLTGRWPHAAQNLARCAALLAEQSQMLAHVTAQQLATVQIAPDTLLLPALLAYAHPQRARILRAWLHRETGSAPSARILAAIESDLLRARHDSDAHVSWNDRVLHRWRDRLYTHPETTSLPPDWSAQWDGSAPLRLPNDAILELRGARAFDFAVTLRGRAGGERIRLHGRAHHHALKHVLQVRDVPPWMRKQMPLLYANDGELLAAGDSIVSARMEEWLRSHNAALVWGLEAHPLPTPPPPPRGIG
ncbi:MAG: tRNA lysidine(34) synthetase TilS [Lysobacteraceae bacterium]